MTLATISGRVEAGLFDGFPISRAMGGSTWRWTEHRGRPFREQVGVPGAMCHRFSLTAQALDWRSANNKGRPEEVDSCSCRLRGVTADPRGRGPVPTTKGQADDLAPTFKGTPRRKRDLSILWGQVHDLANYLKGHEQTRVGRSESARLTSTTAAIALARVSRPVPKRQPADLPLH